MFDLDNSYISAIRKFAPDFTRSVRKVGADLDHFEPHTLQWNDLNRIERDARKAAKNVIERLHDLSDADRANEVETAFDGLNEIAELCASDKDCRSENGNKEPWAGVDLSRRPNYENKSVPAADESYSAQEEDRLAWQLKPQERMTTFAKARVDSDLSALSVGRFLRATVIGAQNDLERRALAEGSDSAGGYTVPEVLSSELIDALRAQSVIVQAGARTVPLNSNKVAVAKLASDPVPAWRLENASVNESDPTFTQVLFEPKSLAVMTKVSFELMSDSVNISTELPRVLAAALAQELDRVALLGSGTAPEPEGVANMTGISTTPLGTSLATYAPFISARTKLLTANAGEPTAIIAHPRDEGAVAGFVDSTGQPLNVPVKIGNVPMLTTTQIPTDGGAASDESTIFVGNFNKLLIGMRQDIRIELLKERYADTLQYALIAHLRADIQAEHTAAFHTITGVQG